MSALGLLPTLFIVWGIVMITFLALLAYRSQITRYEEDQLFLNNHNAAEQQQQTEIVRKINRIKPFVRIVGGVVSLVTIAILGIFAYDAWQRFQ